MIFLVHHGDAVPPGVDPMRPLSARGVAEVQALAAQAAALGARPANIWHSGKLRARQTAEHFWRACNPFAAFSAVRGLQPGDPPAWIEEAIATAEGDVMVVGHYPHLPSLLTHLLAGSGRGGAASPFPMNGVVALEQTGDAWVERWRLDPRELMT